MFTKTKTTLTMIETFNLLADIQLPSTYDNLVKVSGQEATDVARSLAANLNHLTINNGQYSLVQSQALVDALKQAGQLIERGVYMESGHYFPALTVFIPDNNAFSSLVGALTGNYPGQDSGQIWNVSGTYDVTSNTVYVYGYNPDGPLLTESEALQEVEANSQALRIIANEMIERGQNNQFNEVYDLVFEDDVTVSEAEWVKPTGSLI